MASSEPKASTSSAHDLHLSNELGKDGQVLLSELIAAIKSKPHEDRSDSPDPPTPVGYGVHPANAMGPAAGLVFPSPPPVPYPAYPGLHYYMPAYPYYPTDGQPLDLSVGDPEEEESTEQDKEGRKPVSPH